MSALLDGVIPSHIGNLTFLVSLNLIVNQLTGPLSGAALARLRHLHHLDLSSNNLTGSIPTELGSLPTLQMLDLQDNRLMGAIPGALGQLSTLQILLLDGNLGINGEIPPELGSLSQLRNLSIISTNLSGEIPLELGNLANLVEIRITDSHIFGELPLELGNLAMLKVLDLTANFLEGGFPTAVYNMSPLEQLVLANNTLEGPLPRDLSRRLPQSLKDLYININCRIGMGTPFSPPHRMETRLSPLCTADEDDHPNPRSPLFWQMIERKKVLPPPVRRQPR